MSTAGRLLTGVMVTPNGDMAVVGTRSEALRLLYGAIQCESVKLVRLADDLDMWTDQDGAVKDLPVNGLATYIAMRCGSSDEEVYGTAVFLGGAEHGNTRSLDDTRTAELEEVVVEALDIIMAADSPEADSDDRPSG